MSPPPSATCGCRGAPLIGVTAAYGVAIAMAGDASNAALDQVWEKLHETRPTAINLKWALDDMRGFLRGLPEARRQEAAYARAAAIAEEDVLLNRAIGGHGLSVIKQIAARKKPGEPVNILTHCNAGWLATVDYGTATAPIYLATEEGIPVHVYVDETRPRNQGAQLTAWELNNHGVPHTLIVDNAGGHLMQHGQVDMVIVGTDRTTAHGDVCNKIGTYLKALAARDNNVPFYVALPSPTIDWTVHDGVKEIPIEERNADEVSFVQGLGEDGATRPGAHFTGRQPRRQSRLRRDPRPPHHRPHHRTRHRKGFSRRPEGAVSRTEVVFSFSPSAKDKPSSPRKRGSLAVVPFAGIRNGGAAGNRQPKGRGKVEVYSDSFSRWA